MALKFPPQKWIIENLIQTNTVAVLIGPPNAGKTLRTYDGVMQAAAAGHRVLLIEAEGSGDHLKKSLARAAAAHPLSVEQQKNLRIFHNADVDLSSDKGADRIITQARGHGAELIVLDSLSALAGGVDENSSDEMGKLANRLNRIKVEAGCSVLVVHHVTKDVWKEGKTPTLGNLRGHGALAARVDVVLALVPVEAPNVVFDLYDLKQREMGKRPPRRCVIVIRDEVTTFREEGNSAAVKAKTAKDDLRAQVLNAIPYEGEGRGITKTQLKKQVNHNGQDVGRMANTLLSEGAVKMAGRYDLVRVGTREPADALLATDRERVRKRLQETMDTVDAVVRGGRVRGPSSRSGRAGKTRKTPPLPRLPTL